MLHPLLLHLLFHLISNKIGEKEESDLSAKRALLESEKIVNRLPSMAPFKISCTAAFIAYSSAVNIEASLVSLPPLMVLRISSQERKTHKYVT